MQHPLVLYEEAMLMRRGCTCRWTPAQKDRMISYLSSLPAGEEQSFPLVLHRRGEAVQIVVNPRVR